MKHLERRRLIAYDKTRFSSVQDLDYPDRAKYTDYEQKLLEQEPDVFGLMSTAMATVSMFSYVTDVASSAIVCWLLFSSARWWWLWMSVVPLGAALLVVNVFSIRWYLHDVHEEKVAAGMASKSHQAMRVLFHVMLLGPVIRYVELFLYGVHSHDESDPDRRRYQMMVLQEDRDTSLLAFVGSFIKSAPQLVLQLYILTQKNNPTNLTRAQAVSLIISILELSLSQCSYHRALRRSLPDKKNMTKIGTATQFLSNCCIISSRVLALAAFASVYGKWIAVFCAAHWGIMTMWLISQRTTFCASSDGQQRRTLEEMCFNVVIGAIYVFCFINIKDEPTRWKYTVYYLIVFVENAVLVALWFVRADAALWYRIPLVSVVPTSLAIGLVLLVLYYQFLHPNKLVKES